MGQGPKTLPADFKDSQAESLARAGSAKKVIMYQNFALLFLLNTGWDLYPKNIPVNQDPVKTDCLFCQRAHDIKTAFVAKFKHCFVVKDNFPVSPGHLLIIPYQHYDNWFSADQETQLDIMHAIQEMKTVLDAELHPDGYNIGMNCGIAAGQSVMHLHVHLIPRYTGDMENPKGGVRGVIPAKQKY